MLARARALVFGEMRGCDEPGGAVTAIDAIVQGDARLCGPDSGGIPIRAHHRPDVDAAAWCHGVCLDSAQSSHSHRGRTR